MIERLVLMVSIICVFLGVGTGICMQLDAFDLADKLMRAFMFLVQIVVLLSLILLFRLMWFVG